MSEETTTPDVLVLTAQIVSAHVANNSVAPDALPALIQEIYRTLAGVGKEPAAPEKPQPAVPLKKSVFPDHIVCLEDGKKLKMLKRHLKTAYNMTPEQYRVLRQKGTERPFSGEYERVMTPGVYKCAGCGQELFLSDTKFDAGCGWPSFYQAAGEDKIDAVEDNTLGMRRIEVTCSRCGGHLGHVFPDGPRPTGLRYCINSVSLKLDPKQE